MDDLTPQEVYALTGQRKPERQALTLAKIGVPFRDLRDCFVRAFIQSHIVYKPGTFDEIQPNMALSREADKGLGHWPPSIDTSSRRV